MAVGNKLVSDKMLQLSQKVHAVSTVLDDFQNAHIVIKRPEDSQIG
jgi:hypothetical protein